MKEKLRQLFRNGFFRKVCYILFILLLCHFIVDFIEDGRTLAFFKYFGFLFYPFVGVFLLVLFFVGYIIFVSKIVEKVEFISEYLNLTILFVISYFIFSDLCNYVRIIHVAQDNYIQRNLFSEENEGNYPDTKLLIAYKNISQIGFANSSKSHSFQKYNYFQNWGSTTILFNLSSDEIRKLDSVDGRRIYDRIMKFNEFSDTLIPIDKAIDCVDAPYGDCAFFSDCEHYLNFGSYNAVNTKDTLLFSLKEYYSEMNIRLKYLRELGLFNEVKIMTHVSESDYQEGFNFKIGFFGYGLNKHKLFFLGLNVLFFIFKVIWLHNILKSFNLFPNLKKYGLMSFVKKMKITRD
jgi:hypothetical protein